MKMKFNSIFFIIFMMLAFHAYGEPENASFTLLAGFDSRAWTTLTVGFEYPIMKSQHNVVCSTSIPILLWLSGKGNGNFDISVGLCGKFTLSQNLPIHIEYKALAIVIFQTQVLGKFTGIGTNLSLQPFWEFQNLDLGVILTWQKTWISYIVLSNELYETFAESDTIYTPVHGWYVFGSSLFFTGLSGKIKTNITNNDILVFSAGPRFANGSMVEMLEGFSIAEWPFWFSCTWAYNF